MTSAIRGLVLGVLQAALALSVAGKFARDRATLPRVWAETAPIDPELPIRGRYLRLRLTVVGDTQLLRPPVAWQFVPVRLSIAGGQLVAHPSAAAPSLPAQYDTARARWVLVDPVAFYLPEHAIDPSRRPTGERLWVEVSLPRAGLPRPVRLGVKRAGLLTPLPLR
ncbi:MAG: hypothetical protein NVS4B3_10240 [Gemmatimonadaceae bacterium]